MKNGHGLNDRFDLTGVHKQVAASATQKMQAVQDTRDQPTAAIELPSEVRALLAGRITTMPSEGFRPGRRLPSKRVQRAMLAAVALGILMIGILVGRFTAPTTQVVVTTADPNLSQERSEAQQAAAQWRAAAEASKAETVRVKAQLDQAKADLAAAKAQLAAKPAKKRHRRTHR